MKRAYRKDDHFEGRGNDADMSAYTSSPVTDLSSAARRHDCMTDRFIWESGMMLHNYPSVQKYTGKLHVDAIKQIEEGSISLEESAVAVQRIPSALGNASLGAWPQLKVGHGQNLSSRLKGAHKDKQLWPGIQTSEKAVAQSQRQWQGLWNRK